MNGFVAAQRVLAVALVLAFTPAAWSQQLSQRQQEALQRIDALAAAEYAQDKHGSVTVGIVAGPRLVWARSYGYADVDKQIPATPDTVYRIGSITKQFTAVMLGQLVEAGKVKLSDPVDKYLPEFARVQPPPSGAAPVTLAQLATHTSGLAREPDDFARFLKGPVSEWDNVLIAALPHTRFNAAPGQGFAYSNIGYAILGAALGRAAGQPYTTYVQDKVFAPLGMVDTDFQPNARIAPRIAKGYDKGPAGEDADTPLREHQGRGYKVPNGAMYSTVGDLARFLSFELGYGPDSVLSQATLARTFDSTLANPQASYGVGFQVVRRGDVVAVGHTGAVSGYLAAAFVDRASRTGVIVLRSASYGNFNLDKVAGQALLAMAAASTPAEPGATATAPAASAAPATPAPSAAHAAPATAAAPPQPAATPLFRRMETLEAAMTDAFNRCDMEKLETFYDPALEFYHDGAGATWSRDTFIANVRKNACKRFTRHMVPGTLEVWPLGKFGAVYTGSYQACLVSTGKCAAQGRVVMIVQNKDDRWTITRVVSYDHKELPLTLPAAQSPQAKARAAGIEKNHRRHRTLLAILETGSRRPAPA